MVKTRYGQSIRFMRLDGERALGNDFQEFTREEGITVERTAPYTPAQNGNAERAGRVITTMARSIRIDASLPSNLWPEIYRTVGYLLNRLPSRKLDWKSPFEALHGEKPDLAHLYIYGCKAYSLIHGIPRKQKLDPRASIGYLIGYDSRNIYRIWDPTKGVVIRTRDVIFNELSHYQPGSVLQPLQEQVLEVPQVLEEQPSYQSDIEEDEDTIVIQPRHLPTSPPVKAVSKTQDQHRNIDYPTPESTPDRTVQPASPEATQAVRASEISAELTEENILPEGARRSRKPRKEAYFTALEDTDNLSGYHSAFTAALISGKRPHRDNLPAEPKNWKQMLAHPFMSQFKQAAEVEFNELSKR